MRLMDSLRVAVIICLYHSRFEWEEYRDATGRVPEFSSATQAEAYIRRNGLPKNASPVEQVREARDER